MVPTRRTRGESIIFPSMDNIEENSVCQVLTHLFQVESSDFEGATLRMMLLFLTLTPPFTSLLISAT